MVVRGFGKQSLHRQNEKQKYPFLMGIWNHSPMNLAQNKKASLEGCFKNHGWGELFAHPVSKSFAESSKKDVFKILPEI